eukprot:TRINITY_DN48471_c0_g1_i1.p1 TRINITY_DN48471_c0_g1~~TRINITY_DN48471_c0_g1_i1.p1  ORF type:complete len:357 (-),score=35.50 TRINITY_DN48471_c0_g1_i1:146-1216(-)
MAPAGSAFLSTTLRSQTEPSAYAYLASTSPPSASTNATEAVAEIPIRVRRGFVCEKWPCRLDINTEYQDWVLVAVCCTVAFLWCMPCICGRMRNTLSRSFSRCVYTRLHVFFCAVSYLSLILLMLTIGMLPDWTVNEFAEYFVRFLDWTLIHLQKLITSISILFGFFLLFRFRDRIALAAGLEHITVFRFNWRDLVGFGTRRRPVEIFLWKVDQLPSSAGKVLKANDIYVECHLGHNEAMRTRVHNNAGSHCELRESLQLNIDESSPDTLMTLLIKDQSLVGSSELARLILSTREICGIEDQTGKRRAAFDYSQDFFVPLKLSPQGQIWIAVAPVDDVGDDERHPLMNEDSLLSCG